MRQIENNTGSSGFTLPEPLTKWLTVPEFPFHLLGDSQVFCRELAERYAVPPDLIALAMLTVVGGIVGVRNTIATPLRRPAFPHWLAVVSATPGSNAAAALECVVEPARNNQEALILGCANYDHAHREEVLRCTRIQRFNAEQIGRTDQIWEHDTKLANIEVTRSPMLLANSLAKSHLMEVLQNCFRKSLVLFSTSYGAGQRLTPPRGAASDIDWKFVEACLHRQPVTITSKAGHDLITPGLTGLILATPEETSEFLAHHGQLPIGVQTALMCFHSEAKPAKLGNQLCQPMKSLDVWKARLLYLMEGRIAIRNTALYGYEDPIIKVPEAASLRLLAMHNDVVDLLPHAPPAIHSQLLALPDLAWRLCAASHFTQSCLGTPITENTAYFATVMAKWFGGRVISAWVQAQQRAAITDAETTIDLMLARIRFRGPLTRRELYRTYRDQRVGLHEPLIERLLADAKIVAGEDGRLRIKEPDISVDAVATPVAA